MRMTSMSIRGICTAWLFAALCIPAVAQAPRPEPVTDQETELGMAAYKQLLDKGEIVESSPLYGTLKPLADAISRVAQPRYPHPFKFFIVHETQPNAFATPGGNVYVVVACFAMSRFLIEETRMEPSIPSALAVI